MDSMERRIRADNHACIALISFFFFSDLITQHNFIMFILSECTLYNAIFEEINSNL